MSSQRVTLSSKPLMTSTPYQLFESQTIDHSRWRIGRRRERKVWTKRFVARGRSISVSTHDRDQIHYGKGLLNEDAWFDRPRVVENQLAPIWHKKRSRQRTPRLALLFQPRKNGPGQGVRHRSSHAQRKQNHTRLGAGKD